MDARRKNGRLNLRLDEDLLQEVRAYAASRRMTVTTLVEHFFVSITEEEKQKTVEAEQI